MNNNPYPPQNGQNPYEQGTPQNGAPFAPPYGNPGYGYPYYGAPQNPAPQQNPYAGQTPPPVAPPPQPLVDRFIDQLTGMVLLILGETDKAQVFIQRAMGNNINQQP